MEISNGIRLRKCLGQGAYGYVYSAQDSNTGKDMAVKFCSFNCEQTKNEVLCLLLLKRFPNIVKFLGSKRIQKSDFGDFAILLELMDRTLADAISQPSRVFISLHRRTFMKQLLTGVRDLHSTGHAHLDLKSPNILLKNITLKISDFGTCTKVPNLHKIRNYGTVTTWPWASIEMLKGQDYNEKSDIWACGIIFIEMILGYNPFAQLKIKPEWSAIKLDIIYTQYVLSRIHHLIGEDAPEVSSKPIFKSCSKTEKNLLYKLLQFDPDKRISAKQALADPYFY